MLPALHPAASPWRLSGGVAAPDRATPCQIPVGIPQGISSPPSCSLMSFIAGLHPFDRSNLSESFHLSASSLHSSSRLWLFLLLDHLLADGLMSGCPLCFPSLQPFLPVPLSSCFRFFFFFFKSVALPHLPLSSLRLPVWLLSSGLVGNYPRRVRRQISKYSSSVPAAASLRFQPLPSSRLLAASTMRLRLSLSLGAAAFLLLRGAPRLFALADPSLLSIWASLGLQLPFRWLHAVPPPSLPVSLRRSTLLALLMPAREVVPNLVRLGR